LLTLLDEIVFQGEFLKYQRILNKNKLLPKFLVLDKLMIKGYKSKESFLKLQNPTLELVYLNISEVLRIEVDISKLSTRTYYFFVIILKEGNNTINNNSNSYIAGAEPTDGFPDGKHIVTK